MNAANANFERSGNCNDSILAIKKSLSNMLIKFPGKYLAGFKDETPMSCHERTGDQPARANGDANQEFDLGRSVELCIIESCCVCRLNGQEE